MPAIYVSLGSRIRFQQYHRGVLYDIFTYGHMDAIFIIREMA